MIPFTLATIRTPEGPKAAIEVASRFFLLDSLLPDFPEPSCKSLLAAWDTALPRLQEVAATCTDAAGLERSDFEVLTPVLYPDALLAVGANYSGHLKEMGLAVRKWDSMPFFVRPPRTTLVGPGPSVRIPRSTRKFDWECELAVILGRPLRHAGRAEAKAAVAAYAVGLDLSCRDLIEVDNELHVDLVRGKAQDTMAPCGPALRPACFVDDVDDLRITLSVNGQPMMDASTSEMLYKIDEQLSLISDYISLRPGDILFTGSPSGSAGVHGDRWLRDGDQIRAEIEQVGILEVSVHDGR